MAGKQQGKGKGRNGKGGKKASSRSDLAAEAMGTCGVSTALTRGGDGNRKNNSVQQKSPETNDAEKETTEEETQEMPKLPGELRAMNQTPTVTLPTGGLNLNQGAGLQLISQSENYSSWSSSSNSDYQSHLHSKRQIIDKKATENMVLDIGRQKIFKACKYPTNAQLGVSGPIADAVCKVIGNQWASVTDDWFVLSWDKQFKSWIMKGVRTRRDSATTSMKKEFLGVLKTEEKQYLPKLEELVELPKGECWKMADPEKDEVQQKQMFWLLDHFLKCIIGDKEWRDHFVKSEGNFWEHVSRGDLAFLFYMLEENYSNWTDQHEKKTATTADEISDLTMTSAGGKKKKLPKTVRIERFVNVEKTVQEMKNSYGTELEINYKHHRSNINNAAASNKSSSGNAGFGQTNHLAMLELEFL